MGYAMGITYQTVSKPEPLGERAATFVENYLAKHQGLALGELAFRLKADKRDLQRLVRDRSMGPRLLDNLAAYFGDLFIDAVIRDPLLPSGRSIREAELERERAELAARRERVERDRADRRAGLAEARSFLRMAPDQGRPAPVRRGRGD